MTTGHHTGESYQLAPMPTGEVRLTVRGTRPLRGERLARALGARATRGRISLYMTANKAEKWRTLFLGGYVARRRMVLGLTGWGFELGGEVMSLREVMRREKLCQGN